MFDFTWSIIVERRELKDKYNAAMILSGMGPSADMPDVGSKLFAGGYAIFAGLAWTALLSVVLYPFVHRMLHALHLQMQEEDE